jgi:sulfite exporter TauE/SafE
MKFELDIKTIVFICATVVSISGLYYTTQNRLSNLEARVEVIEKDITALAKSKKRGNKSGSKSKKPKK